MSPDEALFTTPSDLLCPITHELLREPVINVAGQVYERRAIEQAMQGSLVDPVSGSPLASPALTPVYVLRSRSLEYRERTVRACVERASGVHCPDRVRYVRRAVELAAGGDVSVPGLSPDCCSYVSNHPSNAYDDLALQAFARGLLQAGQRDQAAAVYCGLLQASVERAQQVELLQACLACWTAEEGGTPDEATFRQLAVFVESQRAFSWGRAVDVLAEAGLGTAFCLQLCEQLLQREEGEPPGDSGGEEEGEGPSPPDWARERSVLLKYMQLVRASWDERQGALEGQVASLQKAQEQARAEARILAAGAARKELLHPTAPDPRAKAMETHPQPSSRVPRRLGALWERRPAWLTGRALGCGVAVMAQLLVRGDGRGPRLARLAPVLFTLHAGH